MKDELAQSFAINCNAVPSVRCKILECPVCTRSETQRFQQAVEPFDVSLSVLHVRF